MSIVQNIGVTKVILYLLAVNVIAFLAMGIDKWKAKRDAWRIPENTLMTLVLLGGGIGGIAVPQRSHAVRAGRSGIRLALIGAKKLRPDGPKDPTADWPSFCASGLDALFLCTQLQKRATQRG